MTYFKYTKEDAESTCYMRQLGIKIYHNILLKGS